MSGSGDCPVCGLPILDHDSDQRKTCHDASSGHKRAAGVSDYRERLPRWPTAANHYNQGERCEFCGATGERLEPLGRGELCCYACLLKPSRRVAEPAQGTLL